MPRETFVQWLSRRFGETLPQLAAGLLPLLESIGNTSLQLATVRIQYTDLASTTTVNVGSSLPAGAVVMAHEVKLDTQFAGGSLSAVKMDLGGNTTTAIINQFDVKGSTAAKTYSPGFEHATSHGTHCTGNYGGEQLVATFTPTGDTLNHATTGDLTINVWYVIKP